MCKICDAWNGKKITTKEAFSLIKEEMKDKSDKKETRHLIELSDRILDAEVPFNDLDNEVDQNWWDENNR